MPPALIPIEIVTKIAIQAGNLEDISNMRLANKAFYHGCLPAFGKYVRDNKRLYPTSSSLTSWLNLADCEHLLPYLREIHVVGVTVREHHYGTGWVVEQIQYNNNLEYSFDNYKILDSISESHHKIVAKEQPFVTTGQYRTALAAVLPKLKHLQTVIVHKNLEAGKHIPGWKGYELLADMIGYREGVDFSEAFYGDWQYDEDHGRATATYGEFTGEWELEDGAGKQASFIDDLYCALSRDGRELEIIWK